MVVWQNPEQPMLKPILYCRTSCFVDKPLSRLHNSQLSHAQMAVHVSSSETIHAFYDHFVASVLRNYHSGGDCAEVSGKATNRDGEERFSIRFIWTQGKTYPIKDVKIIISYTIRKRLCNDHENVHLLSCPTVVRCLLSIPEYLADRLYAVVPVFYND